jgi:hypothetical protein
MQDSDLVKVSSEDRDENSTSSSDFTVSYNNAPCMSNVNRLAIKNIIVPNVFYNINDTGYNTQNNGNNILFIKNITAGIEFDIGINPGNYTINQLITEINTLLSLSGAGLSVTEDAVTKKLVFTSSGDLFAYSTEQLGGFLGMVKPPPFDGLGELVYQLEGFPNLSGVKEIYISSARMSDGSHLVVPFGSTLPVIAAVPLTVGFGEFQVYIAPNIELDEIFFPSYSAGSNLRTIDIQVRDTFGNILDTGGLPTTITFKAWHMQN